MMVSVPLDSPATRPLIGRVGELGQLADSLGLDPESPRSGAVVLAGDAGVGKSRLLAELRHVGTERGWRVLTGHCIDFGDSALPYLPFSELFGRLAAESPQLAAALLDSHPAVRRLMPAIRLASEGDNPLDRPVERGDLLEAVHAALEHLARSSPLLVMVEDVHWADQSTREMLTFLFSRVFSQPVSIIATYRSDDLHRRHPLRTSAAEWSRLPGVSRVQLNPLPDSDVRRLVTSIHPAPMPESDIATIIERAEGNAFFTEELVGAAQFGRSTLPGDLVDLLLVRIDRLDEAARQAVRASAVAGRRVGHDLLSRVVDLNPHDLDHALRVAVERNVLVAAGDDSYSFRHALLAEAVYDDLLPGERVRLHRAYTAALASPEIASTAAEIARHARAAHDLGTAIRASIAAGGEAMSVGGPDEAARHYEVALELIGDGAPSNDSPDSEHIDVIDLVVKASEAITAAGHPIRALELLRDQVAHRAATSCDVDRIRLLMSLAMAALFTDSGTDPLQITTQAMALADGAELPRELQAELYGLHARALTTHRHDADAARFANDALAIGSELRLSTVVAEASTTLSMIDKRAGDPDASKKALRRIIDTAHESGDVMAELRGMHNLGYIHYEQGDLGHAQEVYERAVLRAVEVGRPWAPYGLDARFLAAITAYLRGDWDGTERIVDVTGQAPPVLAETTLASVGLMTAAGRGDDADELLNRTRSVWDRDGMVAVVSGSAGIDLVGDRGDLDGAVALHDDVVGLVSQMWQNSHFQARVRLSALLLGQLAAHAQQIAAADRGAVLKRADGLLDVALEVFDAQVKRRTPMGPEGVAWRSRAVAEHTRLRWAFGIDPPSEHELVDAWRAAVRDFEAMGHVFETARSRARLAAVLMASGQTAEARELAALARQTAQSLGARPLLAELRTVTPSGARRADADRLHDNLTPRERQILALVADGRSNSEIAQQLYISAKTVSVHVSNILAKLGAQGRTEAAALARRQGLLD